MSAAHRAYDNDIAHKTDYERDNMCQDDRHEIRIALPWQQHLFGVLHEVIRVGTRLIFLSYIYIYIIIACIICVYELL